MTFSWCLLLAVTSAAAATPGSGHPAQNLTALPAGLYLPVTLSRTVHAGKTPAGTPLRATTAQRIPLAPGVYLSRGVSLGGSVTTSTPTDLVLTFTSLVYGGHRLALAAHTLAAATFVAVSETAIPANGSTDRGNADPASWTTAQVGGDQIMRSGWVGPLINSTTQTVGSADYWGVYALPSTAGSPPRALGPFSAGSTGLFGYPGDCSLVPSQGLTIHCNSSHPVLHHGDVLLLEFR